MSHCFKQKPDNLTGLDTTEATKSI